MRSPSFQSWLRCSREEGLLGAAVEGSAEEELACDRAFAMASASHWSNCFRTPALTLYHICRRSSGGQESQSALRKTRSLGFSMNLSYSMTHSGGQSSRSSLRSLERPFCLGVLPWELPLSSGDCAAGLLGCATSELSSPCQPMDRGAGRVLLREMRG